MASGREAQKQTHGIRIVFRISTRLNPAKGYYVFSSESRSCSTPSAEPPIIPHPRPVPQEKGVLAKPTHDHIIRFAPPLVISKKELDQALFVITDVLQNAK